MDGYIPRIVDDELESALGRAGAVLVEGARACGKTETSLQAAESVVRFDRDPQAAELLDIEASLVIDGPTPRLFDEWQVAPRLWNEVRGVVDERKQPGQFILTGSTAPATDSVRHTGAGRFARLRMRGMTLCESGHGTKQVSLSELIEGVAPSAPDPGFSFQDLTERIVTGGWPGFQGLSTDAVAANLGDYLETVATVDLRLSDGVDRDPIRVRRLLTALGRSVASEVTISTLARDEASLSRDAVREYLAALTRVFVVEDQPAWSTHLRSSATLRKEVKRHYCDPSLAAAAVGADPGALRKDLRFTGQLFESLVVQHLRVYAQSSRGTVAHARDSEGREVDAIIHFPSGGWAGFEVKLGTTPEIVDSAAESLLAFAQNVVGPELLALTVIVGSGPSYRRKDGVNVVALPALTR